MSRVCHTLAVHIINKNAKEDADNNMFFWEAVSGAGGVYKAPQTNGPDAIVAGGAGNVTLEFDVTDGSNLITLRYRALGMSRPIETPVGSYGAPATYRAALMVTGFNATGTYNEQTPSSAYWLVVNVSVTNNGTAALPTTASNWRLTDINGLTLSTASSQHSTVPATLAGNQTVQATLVFDVGQYGDPAKVALDLPNGESVAAILHR